MKGKALKGDYVLGILFKTERARFFRRKTRSYLLIVFTIV